MELQIRTDKTGFKNSIRKLRNNLPKDLQKSLERSSKEIAKNVKSRLSASYSGLTSPASSGVLKSIDAGKPFRSGDYITVGIGNINKLDQASEVIAKSTGKRYNLWRLMEFGFGMKGGFRNDLYDIYPVMPTSAQGQHYYSEYGGTRRKGVHVSEPGNRLRPVLVFRANGQLIFTTHVKHPGAEGRHFFLDKSGQIYAEDRLTAWLYMQREILRRLDKVNYKGY